MTWHSLHDCLDPASLAADPQRRVLEWVRQAWDSLAGALPPGSVVPRAINRRGVLMLLVRDEGLLPRVRAERAELLKRLQAFLGPGVVTAVRWKIGACPAPPSPGPAPCPSPAGPEAVKAAGAISDPALRELFMAACRGLGDGGGPARG